MAKRPLRRKKVRSELREAGNWPLLECLMTADWQSQGELVQILVARGEPGSDKVMAAVFLVDLACLGVKDAGVRSFATAASYRRELRSRIVASQELADCDPDLAAKVIETAVEYGKSLGFRPRGDYREARAVLGDVNPDRHSEHVPVGGPEGNPLFVAGPYDNVKRVLRILNRNVGSGNYHFVLPMEGLNETDLEGGDFDLLEDADEEEDR